METIIPSFPGFLLILTRISAFFIMMPIFSYKTIPASHRIGLSALLAWTMQYAIDVPPLELDYSFMLLVIKEAAVGLFVGFLAYMLISAIQIAGGLIDFQMGFAMANVIDPQTGAQGPLMGQYLYVMSLLFLLATDGHHLLLDGVFYSYEFIPLDSLIGGFSEEGTFLFVIKSFNQAFIIAFQMAIPIVGSLFIVDIALGILARTFPQLNIFVVGLPVKIIVSFLIMLILMAVMMSAVAQLFGYTLVAMRGLMEWLGGV
ncbi:MAG: flagellar biosynthetic protein FliR [Bacillus sp. (in: firmicutes)]